MNHIVPEDKKRESEERILADEPVTKKSKSEKIDL